MARQYLKDIDHRWSKLVAKGKDLVGRLNKIEGLEIKPIENGTNVYRLETGSKARGKASVTNLVMDQQIYLNAPNDKGVIWFYMNESTAGIDNTTLEIAFRKAWEK